MLKDVEAGTRSYLLASQRIGMYAEQLLLDVEDFVAKFTHEILMGDRCLLREHRQERLIDRLFDVPLYERVQVRRQDVRKVSRDVGAQK